MTFIKFLVQFKFPSRIKEEFQCPSNLNVLWHTESELWQYQNYRLALHLIWATAWQNQQNNLSPVKTQINLGICPVWSESSLCAWRSLGFLATQWVDSEDSDQTGWMPRLIWVYAGRTGHFVGFVELRLISLDSVLRQTKVLLRGCWYKVLWKSCLHMNNKRT